jgi:hypothetical protein
VVALVDTQEGARSPSGRARVADVAAAGATAPRSHACDFFTERFAGGDDTLELVQLRAAANLRPSPELPGRLAAARPDDAG